MKQTLRVFARATGVALLLVATGGGASPADCTLRLTHTPGSIRQTHAELVRDTVTPASGNLSLFEPSFNWYDATFLYRDYTHGGCGV